MNIPHSSPKIVLWKDSEWSHIDGEICRVSDFATLASFVDADGKIHTSKTMPYGSITLECKRLGTNVTGYICHKMDFQHLWAAFRERKIGKDEEVIIVRTRKQYKWKVTRLIAVFMPKLQVMVCPKGAYELMTDPKGNPELSGTAWFAAIRPIVWWKPPVMRYLPARP
jgi:hypothetical protein